MSYHNISPEALQESIMMRIDLSPIFISGENQTSSN